MLIFRGYFNPVVKGIGSQHPVAHGIGQYILIQLLKDLAFGRWWPFNFDPVVKGIGTIVKIRKNLVIIRKAQT